MENREKKIEFDVKEYENLFNACVFMTKASECLHPYQPMVANMLLNLCDDITSQLECKSINNLTEYPKEESKAVAEEIINVRR